MRECANMQMILCLVHSNAANKGDHSHIRTFAHFPRICTLTKH